MKIEGMNMDSVRAFFGKLVRMSFFDLGKPSDTKVASYLTEVLTDFAKTESLYKIKDSEGRKVQTVVDMLLESWDETDENSDLERERMKYIGDFAMFMTGIFRDYVVRGSYLRYYITEGTKSYFLVSKLDLEAGKGNPVVFTMLSRDFEFYSGALDYMRKVYFKSEKSGDPFAGFVSQFSGLRH